MDRFSASSSRAEDEARQQRHILVVEDNTADVFLIRAAIKAAGVPAELHVVKDGEQAIRFFDQADGDQQSPQPDLVLLDINLPRKQGREVLQYMRGSTRCANASVVIVSTSDSEKERAEMSKLGISAYFHKPSRYEEFMKLGDLVKIILNE